VVRSKRVWKLSAINLYKQNECYKK
jgi:hypothetical protein